MSNSSKGEFVVKPEPLGTEYCEVVDSSKGEFVVKPEHKRAKDLVL